jgi:hypothetical protein
MITRAVHEVRPLLAARGSAVPGNSGLRLRTLADVFSYAAAEGVPLRIDGAEVQVRRPRAGHPGGGCSFAEEEAKHDQARSGQRRPGAAAVARRDPPGPHARHHRAAHRGHRGPAAPPHRVSAQAGTGYQGLARDFPGQVSAPPKKPGTDAPPDQTARWEQCRKAQSSQRICIEHAIAGPKQWRSLQRYLGRREYIEDTALAIAGLVSDRCAGR